MPTEPQENCSSCIPEIQIERNHYYTGKFMAASDFETDQQYLVNRHRLHNRLLHGWGIVCGLQVDRNVNPGCATRWVIVRPGSAIDCCGRELFVQEPMAFELPLPRARVAGQPGDPDAMHGPFLLGLAYKEINTDLVPALYAENACDTQRLQPNHVREGVRLVCVPLGMVDDACWQKQGSRSYAFTLDEKYVDTLDQEALSEPLKEEFAKRGLQLAHNARVETLRAGQRWEIESGQHHEEPHGEHHGEPHSEHHEEPHRERHGEPHRFEIVHEDQVLDVYHEQPAVCRGDCDEETEGRSSCLAPTCACQGMVPLALVTFDTENPEAGFHLNLYGRKHLASSADLLTHIVRINWPHGGTLSLHQLRERHGQLRIRFDRKLLHRQGTRNGINSMTFQVQYGGEERELEFMPSEKGPRLEEESCEAVFYIDPDFFTGEARKGKFNIEHNWVYITLKCDFILDCHHIPVDGNHLRGQLPSGDGVPGGTFESWFWVGDEEPGQGGEEHETPRPHYGSTD